MKQIAGWLLPLSLVLATAVQGAEAPDMGSATAALVAGDAKSAVEIYEQRLAATPEVENGHLYYNLGIAYFRQGRTGDALAAFLAARTLLPRDADVAANLRFVMAGIHDKLEAEVPGSERGASRSAFFWLDRFSQREVAISCALVSGFWGLFFGATVLFNAWRGARLAVLGAALLPLFLLVNLCQKNADVASGRWGAVHSKQASVYSGPSAKNTTLFALSEGAPIFVSDRAGGPGGAGDGFLRIAVSDGKSGWIAAGDVRVFGL